MQAITIYRFRMYDITTDMSSVRPLMATREAITRIKGEVIEESAEQVDSSLLDGDGFLREGSFHRGEDADGE